MQSMAFDATMEKQFQAIFGAPIVEDGISIKFTKFAAGRSKEKSRKFRSAKLALQWIQTNVEVHGSIRINDVLHTGETVASCRESAVKYLEIING